eukprot:TRINITY_DN12121_c0_g1_i1.p1 TRINITY_DN12121_c0_g1~~TRINITY_DN12121_c0_g1_i1.p1  ORF type:complete len:695 (+),score=115.85 TRINITY_DN12121_c0_g1_i1:72-2156(+)
MPVPAPCGAAARPQPLPRSAADSGIWAGRAALPPRGPSPGSGGEEDWVAPVLVSCTVAPFQDGAATHLRRSPPRTPPPPPVPLQPPAPPQPSAPPPGAAPELPPPDACGQAPQPQQPGWDHRRRAAGQGPELLSVTPLRRAAPPQRRSGGGPRYRIVGGAPAPSPARTAREREVREVTVRVDVPRRTDEWERGPPSPPDDAGGAPDASEQPLAAPAPAPTPPPAAAGAQPTAPLPPQPPRPATADEGTLTDVPYPEPPSPTQQPLQAPVTLVDQKCGDSAPPSRRPSLAEPPPSPRDAACQTSELPQPPSRRTSRRPSGCPSGPAGSDLGAAATGGTPAGSEAMPPPPGAADTPRDGPPPEPAAAWSAPASEPSADAYEQSGREVVWVDTSALAATQAPAPQPQLSFWDHFAQPVRFGAAPCSLPALPTQLPQPVPDVLAPQRPIATPFPAPPSSPPPAALAAGGPPQPPAAGAQRGAGPAAPAPPLTAALGGRGVEQRQAALLELHRHETEECESNVRRLVAALPPGHPLVQQANAQLAKARQPRLDAACVHCSRPVPATAAFCIHCGRRLSLPLTSDPCSGCGAKLGAGAQFCTRCGKSTAPRDADAARPQRQQSRQRLPDARSVRGGSVGPGRAASMEASSAAVDLGAERLRALVWCERCPNLVEPTSQGTCPRCGAAMPAPRRCPEQHPP